MPACSSLTSSTTIRPSVTWRTPRAASRSGSGTGDLRSLNTATRLRDLVARQPARQRDLLDARARADRARSRRATPCRAAAASPSTTTSSPMKPMTIVGAACSAFGGRGGEARRCRAARADASASTARCRAAPRPAAERALRPCSVPSVYFARLATIFFEHAIARLAGRSSQRRVRAASLPMRDQRVDAALLERPQLLAGRKTLVAAPA